MQYTYTLVDMGTLGGPTSIISGPGVRVLNNAGMVAAQSDTLILDDDTPGGGNPYITHTFLWDNGVRTDLGALLGNNGSGSGWMTESGLIIGNGETGSIDPLRQAANLEDGGPRARKPDTLPHCWRQPSLDPHDPPSRASLARNTQQASIMWQRRLNAT